MGKCGYWHVLCATLIQCRRIQNTIKMTNVTLSIDEEALKQARVLALQQGTSLNALIREYLESYIGRNQRYLQVTERILRQAEQSRFDSGKRKCTREELYER